MIFPLQQATVAPKITSTIKQLLVQREHTREEGQLLAVLENADLSAAALAEPRRFSASRSNVRNDDRGKPAAANSESGA